jgi:hypothetical protein
LNDPALEKAFVDQRPIADAFVQWVADLELCGAAGESAAHAGHHVAIDDQVAGAGAALPGGPEGSPERAFDREIEVGVRQDHERVLAAELERRHL